MSISFGTNIPRFSNISLLLKSHCKDKCDISCLKILDHASTYSQPQIEESFHIEQLKPELNKQVEHVSLSFHFLSYLLLFTGSFSLLFVISCVFHFIG